MRTAVQHAIEYAAKQVKRHVNGQVPLGHPSLTDKQCEDIATMAILAAGMSGYLRVIEEAEVPCEP